ncbi:hypothetical protein J2128_000542 [Methanomicrobium sp. W14]|nr:hypothetical protein [Methanomicrobium sp. W14]
MIDFHKTHVNLNINFKTGYPRQIPIILYKEYITLWRNTKDPEPGKPVFLNRYKEPYQYPALRKRLRVLANRAGLKTSLPPHLLRHTRITHMIQEGMNRETVGLICWGKVNAMELDRYAHMFGSVDDIVLRHYGLKQNNAQNAPEKTEPILCPDCGYVNPPGSLFCFSCNRPLTKEAAKTVENFSKNITPEMVQEMVALFLQKQMEEKS